MIGRVMTAPLVLGALAALAGCGSEPAKEVAEAPAASLTAGKYAVQIEVSDLTQTDLAAPSTTLKKGDKGTVETCVAADGTFDTKLFAEGGDKCTQQGHYARNGRASVQLLCTRPGEKGSVVHTVDGSFTRDGFQLTDDMGTQFRSETDYRLIRKLNGTRTGECPAAPAEGAKG